MAKASTAPSSFAQETLRAWYFHRQGLDGSLERAKSSDVIRRAGWARSVGGSGPYLTLFSRAGISREAADAAVAALEIHELPSARNCTYVLPVEDFALGLKAGQSFAVNEMKVAYKLGVTDKEIDKLCDGVVKSLSKGPLPPDQIRDATGGLSRSLGEEGKKKGLTTTLPLALGKLQAMGEIRRVPIGGRLDRQRYHYTLWRPNPLKTSKLTDEEASAALAQRFFSWIAPASMSEFQAFSGLGVKAARSAIEPLKLGPLAPGDPRLLSSKDRDNLQQFRMPRDPCYALVSSLDSVSLLRSDLRSMLDPSEWTNPFFATKSGPDLRYHAILDRGRIVGLWQYDPASESIAWTALIRKNRDLESAVARTGEFIRQQLGDVRVSALDSPKSREPLIQALRNYALRNA